MATPINQEPDPDLALAVTLMYWHLMYDSSDAADHQERVSIQQQRLERARHHHETRRSSDVPDP